MPGGVCAGAGGRGVQGSGGVDKAQHPKHCGLRLLQQRPHHPRLRGPHLALRAVPRAHAHSGELTAPRRGLRLPAMRMILEAEGSSGSGPADHCAPRGPAPPQGGSRGRAGATFCSCGICFYDLAMLVALRRPAMSLTCEHSISAHANMSEAHTRQRLKHIAAQEHVEFRRLGCDEAVAARGGTRRKPSRDGAIDDQPSFSHLQTSSRHLLPSECTRTTPPHRKRCARPGC